MAGFAARHPDEVAGLVLVETPKAITILPPEVAAEIACDSSGNIEHRDYYAVEHDVWDNRTEIGDFPMTIISNDPTGQDPQGDEITNVQDQRGWLVLSPQATQVVVTSGHDVPINEPDVVVEVVLSVLPMRPEPQADGRSRTWHAWPDPARRRPWRTTKARHARTGARRSTRGSRPTTTP